MLESLKKLFGANDKHIKILAPVKGRSVPLKNVPDPAFSDGMLGQGMAIEPADGRLVAPVNGKVLGIFRTCHAVTLLSEEGVELLIHIGLDTVKLEGEHFTPHVKKGDMVKPGDLMMEFDVAAITAAGYNLITPVLVCNAGDYSAVSGIEGAVEELGDFISISK